ncbi:LEA type 2 family protein [Cognatiluteimonas profundi]|uniref:NDR1/HIN1-like protein n=1 Tax=Cognatiluteimonas profundi TaxID=2594501 RepID=UPI00131DDFA8|nr:LEA type 2 family protein [Lysobacter profundi]
MSLLLASCASGPSRRVSDPAANIQQLTVRANGSWSLDVRIDNFSNVPMRFDSIRLAMVIGDVPAGTIEGHAGLSIGPESADVATVALVPSSAAKIVMADALARGTGVTYSLEGTVDAGLETGSLHSYRIKRSNALAPVPGLAGVLR